MVEEVGPDAADLDEGALERREDVRAEEVGAAAVGAEVQRLVAAAGGGARGRRRGALVGEEDVHVLGAARAVGLRADAARLRLVGGGGAAPGARGGGLPLAPLLEAPVRRCRWGDCAGGRRGRRGALGRGEGGGGARGGAGEATPPEEAGHGGVVGADGWIGTWESLEAERRESDLCVGIFAEAC